MCVYELNRARESFSGFVTLESREMNNFFPLGLLNRVIVNLELPSAMFLGYWWGVFIIIEHKAVLSRKVRPSMKEGKNKEGKVQINIKCLLIPRFSHA